MCLAVCQISMEPSDDVPCVLAFAAAVSLQAMLQGLPYAALTKAKFAAVSSLRQRFYDDK